MNDQTDNMDAISAAFASAADAAAQFLAACQQVWNTISEIVADVLQAIGRIWRKWRAAHLISRQYRDTIARRKIRRYILMYRN